MNHRAERLHDDETAAYARVAEFIRVAGDDRTGVRATGAPKDMVDDDGDCWGAAWRIAQRDGLRHVEGVSIITAEWDQPHEAVDARLGREGHRVWRPHH